MPNVKCQLVLVLALCLVCLDLVSKVLCSQCYFVLVTAYCMVWYNRWRLDYHQSRGGWFDTGRSALMQ